MLEKSFIKQLLSTVSWFSLCATMYLTKDRVAFTATMIMYFLNSVVNLNDCQIENIDLKRQTSLVIKVELVVTVIIFLYNGYVERFLFLSPFEESISTGIKIFVAVLSGYVVLHTAKIEGSTKTEKDIQNEELARYLIREQAENERVTNKDREDYYKKKQRDFISNKSYKRKE